MVDEVSRRLMRLVVDYLFLSRRAEGRKGIRTMKAGAGHGSAVQCSATSRCWGEDDPLCNDKNRFAMV